MKTNNPTPDLNNADRWILGLFYYNKNDHRIFPPKRCKYLGWTINFAHPYSIFAYLILIVAVLSLLYLF